MRQTCPNLMTFSVKLENWFKEPTSSEPATRVLFKSKIGHFTQKWRDNCSKGEQDAEFVHTHSLSLCICVHTNRALDIVHQTIHVD